jgi:predicted Zn-dependent protease
MTVQINLNADPAYTPYTQLESDSLMCEEVGHAFGLDHKDDVDSCMSQSWSLRRWDTHDKNHINSWY